MKAILIGSLSLLAQPASAASGAEWSAALGHDHAQLPGLRLGRRSDTWAHAGNTTPLRLRAGLGPLILRAERGGAMLGLVVAVPTDLLAAAFSRLALAPETFDTIVTADHVVAGKPAPDCYHFAAAMLATKPEDCLAVEDAPAGVAAARGAGMRVLDATGRLGTDPDVFAQVRQDIAAVPRSGVAP